MGVSSKKTDRPDSGYENTLTRFGIGTRFEQYNDIFFSPRLELAFDDMKVDSTASDSLKTSWRFHRIYFWLWNSKRHKR